MSGCKLNYLMLNKTLKRNNFQLIIFSQCNSPGLNVGKSLKYERKQSRMGVWVDGELCLWTLFRQKNIFFHGD